MTNSELNRDIKRLAKSYEASALKGADQNDFIKEFRRLYHADDKFTAMNKNSVLIMIRLNLILRALPLHTFGLNIEIPKLI